MNLSPSIIHPLCRGSVKTQEEEVKEVKEASTPAQDAAQAAAKAAAKAAAQAAAQGAVA